VSSGGVEAAFFRALRFGAVTFENPVVFLSFRAFLEAATVLFCGLNAYINAVARVLAIACVRAASKGPESRRVFGPKLA
jgi:hypothetical protein